LLAHAPERSRMALLESSRAMPGLSGWSYIAGPAVATLETRDGLTTLHATGAEPGGPALATWTDPFEALREVLARLGPTGTAQAAPVRPQGLAFAGGLVGHLGYDLARYVERLPAHAQVDPALPDMRLHVCDHVLAFDHARGEWHFCNMATPWGLPDEREAVWARTLEQAGDVAACTEVAFKAGAMASRTPPGRYLQQVRQVLDYIAAGDIFQANLSHRLEGSFEGDAFALYRQLTAANPAPFAAYLQGDDHAIASVSPERFLKLAGREVSARPIKGTRARGADAAQDAQARDELQMSVKDRAENVMIVDLMRNDLGRVAQVGSVRAAPLFELEPHPSVWQMVSTVTARLRDDAGVADLLRACWPPGSMTGAPKVRAMEIIDELEPVRRGPYAGAIGYFDAGGAMDLSVVIRTAVVTGDRVMVQVGGAVVADSDPQQELEETYAKGRLLLAVLQGNFE
jgi:para-aminobenzoate synthetase component 1